MVASVGGGVDLAHKTLLTFDVVGTLIDFEAGIVGYLRDGCGCADEPEVILAAFGAAEGGQQDETPWMTFTQMLEPVFDRMAGVLDVSGGSGAGFRASIADWPAFPDSVDALAKLGSRHRLVALTNADNGALEAMSATLGDPFDDTVTCEDVGANKPDPRMFAWCSGRQSVHGHTVEGTLHVAQSQYHDIGVSMRLGYTTCWVERRSGVDGFGATPPPDEVTSPDLHVSDLASVADILGV